MVDCDIFPKKIQELLLLKMFGYERETCMMLEIMSGADGSHSLFTSCENP